jgi:iron(III) transport system substrate-binding protein
MGNKKALLIFTLILILVSSAVSAFAEEIVVYSARKESLTKIPFNEFFRDTGIRIKLVTGNISDLLYRLQKEGENSPADMLITVDAGSLWKATLADLFQPINSDTLKKNIPSHLRDPQNHWFGLSKRARTIVYSSKRVTPSYLSTYEDLAQLKWQDKICLRTSNKVYNQSLVAMMITEHGVERTEEIVKGWVKNLAEEPFAKDNDVIMAIAEKQCDVGIVNHYYLGRMLKRNPNIPVDLFWPNQGEGEGEGGVYVDISGAGVMKNAKNKDLAVKLLNWLSSEKAQNLFADSNMEYPVNPSVKPNPQVQAWGDFKQNTENIIHSGKNLDTAIELMQRVNYR